MFMFISIWIVLMHVDQFDIAYYGLIKNTNLNGLVRYLTIIMKPTL